MHEKNTDFEEEKRKKPDWAERITQARKSKNISQRDLGKKIGGNQVTILFYEKGKREPKISYLMDLLRLTGVDGDWLLTGKGDMYGEEKKKITNEDAIYALFGTKADELVLYLLEAIKDPFLKAFLFTKSIEYKSPQKKE